MKKFEYRTEQFYFKGMARPKMNNSEFSDWINGIGAEGWELVSCSPVTREGGFTGFLLLVFKKEIEE